MKITRWGELGILCCLYLAKNPLDKAVSALEISKSQAIPADYVQQILQRLRKGKIVKSVRGPSGGYLLSRSPAEINLLEIFEVLEGGTFELVCDTDPVYENTCPSNQSCGVRWLWQGLKKVVDDYLSGMSLALLLEEQKKRSKRVGDSMIISISRRSK